MASKISESFAKYRWCPNIIGPQSGGTVHDLPVYNFEAMGQIETKIPTEILVSDRREYELAEAELPLSMSSATSNGLSDAKKASNQVSLLSICLEIPSSV